MKTTLSIAPIALILPICILIHPATAREPDSCTMLLTPYVDRHELAGAVGLVVSSHKVLSIDTVGFADIANQKPMRKDTLFWIASQTKPMTAAAVMMLVDEGRIKLDEPVETYLPEFKGQMVIAEQDDDHILLKNPSHPITVREVLSHMSGLPFRSAIEEPFLDALPLEKAVRSYAMTPLQTEPGTHYQYANAGINTAARIIEVISGMAYEDFMQRRLLAPLGMNDTTFWPTEEQEARIARSYRPNPEGSDLEEFPISQLSYPLSNREDRYPMPAGGLFSTAHDTAKFCQMMLNGGELNGKRYISEMAFKELTRRQTPDTVQKSYGLGFTVDNDSFGHSGAHKTRMEIFPEKNIAVIWMVQHRGFPGEGKEAEGVFINWAVETFGDTLN